MEQGVKFDQGKLRFDLLPPLPLMKLAAVYTMGAEKYGDRNWEKGMKWGRLFAAIMRHLWKWWAGEEKDPESGLPHLAHAAWGCLALLEYRETHPELDDRPACRNAGLECPAGHGPMELRRYTGTATFRDGPIHYQAEKFVCPECGLEAATPEQAARIQKAMADARGKKEENPQ